VRELSGQKKALLDGSGGDGVLNAVAGRRGFRDWPKRHPGLALAYRIAIGAIGTMVLLAGIVMIPYPGPGWLVVFAGLAILSTEFIWAERVLHYAKDRYDTWNDWLRQQRPLIRIAVWTATAMVVVATLWLLGVYEMVGGWFGLDWPWLASPVL